MGVWLKQERYWVRCPVSTIPASLSKTPVLKGLVSELSVSHSGNMSLNFMEHLAFYRGCTSSTYLFFSFSLFSAEMFWNLNHLEDTLTGDNSFLEGLSGCGPRIEAERLGVTFSGPEGGLLRGILWQSLPTGCTLPQPGSYIGGEELYPPRTTVVNHRDPHNSPTRGMLCLVPSLHIAFVIRLEK